MVRTARRAPPTCGVPSDSDLAVRWFASGGSTSEASGLSAGAVGRPLPPHDEVQSAHAELRRDRRIGGAARAGLEVALRPRPVRALVGLLRGRGRAAARLAPPVPDAEARRQRARRR